MNDVLNAYELERKELKKSGLILTLIGVLLMVSGIILMVLYEFIVVLFLGFMYTIVAIAIHQNKKNKFLRTIKAKVVTNMIKEELGDDAIYIEDGGISVSDISRLGVYRYPDRSHIEDYIKSTYNGIAYEMADAHFEDRREYRDSNGNRRVEYVTYFKGRVIRIDFKKQMNFKMKIIEGSPFGLNTSGYESLETEVIEFNKKYNTYVNNKEEAYYYLTPVFIQKLLEIEKLFKGTIQFVMDGDYFYVLINNSSDSLEFSIHKPIDEKMLNIIRSQINLGAAIINELKLDTDKFNMNVKL